LSFYSIQNKWSFYEIFFL